MQGKLMGTAQIYLSQYSASSWCKYCKYVHCRHAEYPHTDPIKVNFQLWFGEQMEEVLFKLLILSLGDMLKVF